MRLAIDVRSLMEERHSGVQEYTIQLIRAFLRVAPEHTYRLFYNSARPVTLPNFPGRVEVVGKRYPNKILNAAQWAASLPRWDSLLNADCFFVPSLRLMPLSPTTPLVTTVHDLSFERFPEFFSWQRNIWHRLMRPRLLMHNSDHLIAVSASSALDLQELYAVPREKITVIHSGINILPVTTRNSLATVRKKYRLPDRFMLYIGTLEPRKNIVSIIRAFSLIADTIPHHLVIAGVPGWLTDSVKQAIAVSPYRERIVRPGFIADVDKMSLYAAADAFVYPSFYEGFGFPALEALAMGTPVITSLNSSFPEVVGKWATLVDPYNIGELALVMREVVQDSRRVPPATQQAIQQHFSWDRAAEKTLAVIESVS